MLKWEWPLLLCAAIESVLEQIIAQAPQEYARAKLDGRLVRIQH